MVTRTSWVALLLAAAIGCAGTEPRAEEQEAGSEVDAATADAGGDDWPTFEEDLSPEPTGIRGCTAQLARRVAAAYETAPSSALAGVLMHWACSDHRDVRPGRGVEVARMFSPTPISSSAWLAAHCGARGDSYSPGSLLFHVSALLGDDQAIAEYELCATGEDDDGLLCFPKQDAEGRLVMHVSWHPRSADPTLALSWDTLLNVEMTGALPTQVTASEPTSAAFSRSDAALPTVIRINATGSGPGEPPIVISRTCREDVAGTPPPFAP
jgi:hypothetical protein